VLFACNEAFCSTPNFFALTQISGLATLLLPTLESTVHQLWLKLLVQLRRNEESYLFILLIPRNLTYLI